MVMTADQHNKLIIKNTINIIASKMQEMSLNEIMDLKNYDNLLIEDILKTKRKNNAILLSLLFAEVAQHKQLKEVIARLETIKLLDSAENNQLCGNLVFYFEFVVNDETQTYTVNCTVNGLKVTIDAIIN